MDEVVAFIKKRIDVLNPEGLAEDLSIAVALYYTAATYYARKEAIYSVALAREMNNLKDKQGNMKEKETEAKAATAEMKYRLSVAKGILDALEIKIDSLRTLISKAKEEMRLTK